jgi:GNAT superfamily N-acetyltransferase
LTYREWSCGHDEIKHCRSLDDLDSWFAQPCIGTVETAGAPWWRLLQRFGDVKVAVVRRPVDEVVASLQRIAPAAFETAATTAAMQQLDRKLEQIERRLPNVLSVSFADLDAEAECRRLWEHCLPHPWDAQWWGYWRAVNIQENLGITLRYFSAYRPQLEKLAKTAKHRIIAGMRPVGREYDGVEFQVEPFRSFYTDAEHLFEEHLVQTGQSPDDHRRKNLPLLAELDDIGALQCLTARIQQRMVGYLMTVIGPSLDAPDKIIGEHTIFFASPDVRGLGMRLQRAALDALRARGVDEVTLRAGHRGSGPRLGTFYRRLGAEPFGNLYRLEI